VRERLDAIAHRARNRLALVLARMLLAVVREDWLAHGAVDVVAARREHRRIR
jgi:hypothetical protein